MSFQENASPFPSFSGSTDAITLAVAWPQGQMNNDQFDSHSQFEQYPPFKRPRIADDNQSVNSRLPPQNIPFNKGASNIFFKTRMCAKFRNGSCRNGENCNFAHGLDDLRQPPPNWQELVSGSGREEDRTPTNWEDDQKIIQKMNLCKKFYNGEECPYGERCNFLHEDPARFRELPSVSIRTTGPQISQREGSNHPDGNRPMNNAGLPNVFQQNIKPAYLKTKLCTKWETTGTCSFGDKCHFAHGQAELQLLGGCAEFEARNSCFRPQFFHPIDASQSKIVGVPALAEDAQAKKCLRWKGTKKINLIYGDWLDDVPLVHNFPNTVEG